MTIEVSIDEFNMSQFEQLVALFASYFPADDKLLSEGYTQWLYGKNPCGLARMVKAVEGGRWIGFMAMIPVNLVRRNEQLVAYYVVNVLVHPEYHGKNIFGRMITAAKELVQAESAVLMGHPNDMALKSWQRASMSFQDVLRPFLALPKLRTKGIRARAVNRVDELQPLLPALNDQALLAERWSISLTAEYIRWRFFEHPANRYQVQLIEADNVPLGFMISKKVRTGISLLVDQFMLDKRPAGGLGRLPWLTISFRPQTSASEYPGAFWLLPVKKQIPFFFTHYQKSFTARDVMSLGLSGSDF